MSDDFRELVEEEIHVEFENSDYKDEESKELANDIDFERSI